MNFYLILLLAASTFAVDFDCLKGPKFWCSSLANAQKCGRITECFVNKNNNNDQNGVSKMSKLSNHGYCELCETVVGELEKHFIPQLSQQQFIDYVVNNVCNKLNEEYKELCATLIGQYGAEIYTKLVSLINPANVCRNMQLCKGETQLIGSPESCKVCKEVLAYALSILENLTPAEIKTILKEFVCNQLPPGTNTMCKTLVDMFTDQLYELLKSLLDGDRVCPALHMCSSNVTKTTNKEFGTSWNCQSCLDVVTVLKKDLVSVTTAQVTALIKSMVCSKVPFLVKDFCDESVDKYVGSFMTDIHSPMTPQQLCAKNALCAVQKEKKTIIKTVTPQQLCAKNALCSVQKEKKTIIKTVTNFIECDACKLFVKEIRKVLLTKEGELKVKNFIKNRICNYLGSERQKCMDFVDKYGDILINFINSELTDLQICQLFGACSETKNLLRATSMKLGDIKCEACQLILNEVKTFISNPTNEAAIKNFIKNHLCIYFGNEKTQCQQTVDEYFTIIMNAFIAEFDVDTLCKLFKFCPQVTLANVKGEVECKVCEVVMKEVINLVTSNVSQQKILALLKTDICPRFEVLKNECIVMANTYLPYLFKIAKESLNSKILCSRLHLCSLVSQKKVNALLKSMKIKSFQCNLCQFSVNETISLLSDSKIQIQLENFLKEEICPHFGANKQKCENDITEYYSFVINIILEYLTPSICSDLRICPAFQRPFECKLCPKFYKFLKTVTDTTSAVDIDIGLVSVCNPYYHEDKKKCLDIVNVEKLLMKSIKVAKNEFQFCEMSKMCVASSASAAAAVDNKLKTMLLGHKQCSWGPGFWCISRRHAEFCGVGAVRHCETLNAWKIKTRN